MIHTWFVSKWRDRAAKVGTFEAARQMRKQGIPVEIALLALAR